MKLINSQKKTQQGFTLIELVVVIVILGILAVTAVPKFVDLSSDARASVVDGVKGAINSAADMAHAKAIIDGKLAVGDAGVTQFITVGGVKINLNYGWPTSTSLSLLLSLDPLAITTLDATPLVTYSHADISVAASANCQATYTESVGPTGARPVINSNVTVC